MHATDFGSKSNECTFALSRFATRLRKRPEPLPHPKTSCLQDLLHPNISCKRTSRPVQCDRQLVPLKSGSSSRQSKRCPLATSVRCFVCSMTTALDARRRTSRTLRHTKGISSLKWMSIPHVHHFSNLGPSEAQFEAGPESVKASVRITYQPRVSVCGKRRKSATSNPSISRNLGGTGYRPIDKSCDALACCAIVRRLACAKPPCVAHCSVARGAETILVDCRKHGRDTTKGAPGLSFTHTGGHCGYRYQGTWCNTPKLYPVHGSIWQGRSCPPCE